MGLRAAFFIAAAADPCWSLCTQMLTLTTSPKLADRRSGIADAAAEARALPRARNRDDDVHRRCASSRRCWTRRTRSCARRWRARADFESGNFIRRAKAMVPLLVAAVRRRVPPRAGIWALAMEARCYRGGEGRTRMRQLRYGFRDAVGAGAMAAAAGRDPRLEPLPHRSDAGANGGNMRRIHLTVEYDGTRYAGWQRQANRAGRAAGDRGSHRQAHPPRRRCRPRREPHRRRRARTRPGRPTSTPTAPFPRKNSATR